VKQLKLTNWHDTFFIVHRSLNNEIWHFNLYLYVHVHRCSVRFYPQLFVGRRVSYLGYLCMFAHVGVRHILCCVFVLFCSSCVPYVASFAGFFFFLDCHFGILYRLFSNMTSFFRFVSKWAIYQLGIISLAHAPVHLTDFPVVNVHLDELSSARIWHHKLCATFSANVNINYRLPVKVYYRICTLRHTRIEINHESQNVFCV